MKEQPKIFLFTYDDKIKSLHYDKILSNYKIQKQLKNVPTQLRTIIINWFRIIYNKSYNFLTNKDNIFTNIFTDENIYENVFVLFNTIMDIYLISRLFRLYNTDSNTAARNSIIYVGNAHAKIYVNFLIDIGFIPTAFSDSTEIGKGFQCVPTTPFKLPFFS